MKRIALIILFIAGLGFAYPKAHAQIPLGPTATACRNGNCTGITDPVGTCDQYTPRYTNTATSTLWACGIQNTWQQIGSGGGGSSAFSAITGGTNTSAAMVVGSGSSLTATGTGAINATNITATTNSTLTSLPNLSVASSNLPASVLSVAQVGGIWCNWDSYGYGLGPLNPSKYGVCQLVSADTPAPLYQISQNGATLSSIAQAAFVSYFPNGYVPDVAIVGAGENDSAPTCASATVACGYAWKEMKMGNMMHFLVPLTYSNSILASNSTITGAAVTNDTSFYGTFNKTALGYPVTTNGASTLTFNIPSSSATKIQIHYIARTANTGSFAATIDGTPLTDESSGTTTFSGAPITTTWTLVPGFALYTQEFTVTPNQAHTVVITTTGITEISRVTWNASAASAPKNIVFDMNVVQVWGNYALQNTVNAALDAQLRAEGFQVASVDIQNGTATSSTYWSSLNATAYPQAGVPYNAYQFALSATQTCTASQSANHPNECGTQDWYRNILNAQANIGTIISRVSLGGKYTEQGGILYKPIRLINPKFQPTLLDLSHGGFLASYIGANAFGGLIYYTDSSSGKPWSGKNITALVHGNFSFMNCGAYISGYLDTQVFANANQNTTYCDDPDTGIGYRTQYIATGTAPTIAAGAAAGTGPTVTVTSGANMAHRISITTGTSTTASAVLATVTFSGTLATAPQTCVLQPTNVNAIGQASMVYPSYPTTTGYTISVGGAAIPASTTYTYGVTCQ